MKRIKAIIIAIGVLLAGYLIYQFLPVFFFLFVMLTDTEGRLNNQELVSNMIINNQMLLSETAEKVLNQYVNMDIVINKEGVSVLSGDKQGIPKSINDYDAGINWLFQEDYVEKIRVYNCQDIQIVLFQTSSSGIIGSGKVLGFCYLNKGNQEQIFKKYSFFPGKEIYYVEVLPKWFYYECSE